MAAKPGDGGANWNTQHHIDVIEQRDRHRNASLWRSSKCNAANIGDRPADCSADFGHLARAAETAVDEEIRAWGG